MKKPLLIVGAALLLMATACHKDSLENTVWLHVGNLMNSDSTQVLVRDSTTLDFIDDESGTYKCIHETTRDTTTERATFFYSYDGSHGSYSVKQTYAFDVKGSLMEVHLMNVPGSDTLIYTKIYDEKGM